MKFLAIHPSGLMFTKVFLRLEPLGLEIIAGAARAAGHDVRLIDLQVETHADFDRLVRSFQPDVLAFSCNYLANVPEVIDLAKAARLALPQAFILIGGHSASFIAQEILEHGAGAIDCVLRGEGEAVLATFLDAVEHDRGGVTHIPGAVTRDGTGPAPRFVASLDESRPARDLLRHRRKYFIGVLDPCASVEFARGCPWDCTFCSAWTFYGRSYRAMSVDRAVEEVAAIPEPSIFLVDDVAFVHEAHGLAIGEGLARRGIRKQYYLETRCDVLLRNKDVFKFWSQHGLKYMFIGLEAVDQEGLKRFRKRIAMDRNFEALEFARSLGIMVAINLIADPDWDHARFETIRQWCLDIPEIVNVSVNTPYPGTEIWRTDDRPLRSLDYRLYDIQHAVLPTRLPLEEFYAELVKTQRALYRRHVGWQALVRHAGIGLRNLMHGQTNYLRMLWNFNSVYDPRLQLADHAREVRYRMTPPPSERVATVEPRSLYIHQPQGRKGRASLDDAGERFVDGTRMGAAGT